MMSLASPNDDCDGGHHHPQPASSDDCPTYRRQCVIIGKYYAFFFLFSLIQPDNNDRATMAARHPESQPYPMTTMTGVTFSPSVLAPTRYHWQVSIF